MPQMTISKKNIKALQNCSKEFDILTDTIRPFSSDENVKKINRIQSSLQLAFKEPLILEDMEKIEQLSPYLHSLLSDLNGFHPKFLEQINQVEQVISTAFAKYRKNYADSLTNKMHGFDAIQEKNKLWAVWSEYKIKPSDMKKQFSDKPVESLTYESWGPTIKMPVGKITTWLEMWKIADKVMKLSGDTHHIFIEKIAEDEKKPGHFKLITGS